MKPELKYKIISFCESIGIEIPRTDDDIKDVVQRMLAIGVLDVDDLKEADLD